MSHVERYNASLRSAYRKIRYSLPKSETRTDCFKMAFKAVNDFIGPAGLCPTTLVYVTFPKPARAHQAETQKERSSAVEK